MQKRWKRWIPTIIFACLLGCAGFQPAATSAQEKVIPLTVEITGVERLNAVAAQPPFQKTDTLVFRVNFKMANPNPHLAKIEELNFEVKVEDGTTDKTIVLTGAMPSYVIPASGEMTWSATEPYIYGGVLGSYMLRGIGGEEGVKGVAQKVEKLWQDLGTDQRKFFIEGNYTFTLPDLPQTGIVRQSFQSEFTMPQL